MGSIKHMYKDLLLGSGFDVVKTELAAKYRSIEKADINSWKAALYRALMKQSEECVDWISVTR